MIAQLEKSLSLYLDIPDNMNAETRNSADSVWDNSTISIQVNEPLGSPIDISEEDAKRIAREAFE